MDWPTGVHFTVGAGILSLHHHVCTGFGTHPAFCPMGTVISLRAKQPGHEGHNLHVVPRLRMCGLKNPVIFKLSFTP